MKFQIEFQIFKFICDNYVILLFVILLSDFCWPMRVRISFAKCVKWKGSDATAVQNEQTDKPVEELWKQGPTERFDVRRGAVNLCRARKRLYEVSEMR